MTFISRCLSPWPSLSPQGIPEIPEKEVIAVNQKWERLLPDLEFIRDKSWNEDAFDKTETAKKTLKELISKISKKMILIV